METHRTVASLREHLKAIRRSGRSVGFVPTMGFLHAGHLALIAESISRCDATVVSIFVNPKQFGATEDLASYPRALDRDSRLCASAGADLLFLPDADEIYPPGFQTHVEPGALAEPLCGSVRPGHFRGVTTVVAKLFNIVQPDIAFFGQKDYQQCAVIRRMVRDLAIPLEVAVVPTVREPDGLAMSSRNSYLGPSERVRARCLSRGLFAARSAFEQGERDSARLLEIARAEMAAVDQLQYLEIRDAQSLETITGPVHRSAVLLVAAHIGSTRLIDNVVLDPTLAQPSL